MPLPPKPPGRPRPGRPGPGRSRSVSRLANTRQRQALAAAKDSLGLVRGSIEAGMPEDMFTIDLADAYRELGLILGEEVEDELIDKIFAEFCMGK